MPLGEVLALAGWTFYLWLVGWAVWPLSSRWFGALTDRGLAAGRVALVVGSTLLCFWGASAGLVPLGMGRIWFWLLPLAAASEWRRVDVRGRFKSCKRQLLASDLVFMAAWVCFVFVRLKNLSVNDLEKPMDMALISGAMRANFLPFENPWFAGQAFTNYYYFGPLMGAMLARSLGTVPWLAYNLIQPAFCAFFLSVLWSACAALTGSGRWGLAAMALVGLGGHLEPLRQMAAGHFWPLDWWATSRVIPNTINEYPAFTLLIGDAHAHFYALSLTALFLTVGANLVIQENCRQRQLMVVFSGVLLGAVLLTNTWDAPLLGVFLAICLIRAEGPQFLKRVLLLIGTALLAVLTAAPYFLRFKSQISGVQWDPWLPPMGSFLLLWGVWLLLAGFAFVKREDGGGEEKPREAVNESLAAVGLIALIVPYLVYIRGAFGDGDFRHMDTVFKFGLQAWLLLGTGAACECFRRLRSWLPKAEVPARWATYYAFACGGAMLALAPICVAYARMVQFGPPEGGLSLNAMRFLPEGEQRAVKFLHSQPPAVVVQPSSQDFMPMGARFSTFSGQLAPLGWPQHVAAWGADGAEIQWRDARLQAFYLRQNNEALTEMANKLGVAYVVLTGSPEDLTNFDARDAMERSRAYGTPVFNGGTEAKPEYPVVVRYGEVASRK